MSSHATKMSRGTSQNRISMEAHEKVFSATLVAKEVQNKITLRCYHTPIRAAIFKSLILSSVGKDDGGTGIP